MFIFVKDIDKLNYNFNQLFFFDAGELSINIDAGPFCI